MATGTNLQPAHSNSSQSKVARDSACQKMYNRMHILTSANGMGHSYRCSLGDCILTVRADLIYAGDVDLSQDETS